MAKWGSAIGGSYVRSGGPASGPKRSSGGPDEYVEERAEARRFNFLEPAGGQLTRSYLDDNKLAAAKLKAQLDLAGVTGGDNYDEVKQAMMTGAQKGLGFLGNVLETIDKPLRTVKAAILDLSALDEKAGKEIDFTEAAAGIWKGDDERLRRAAPASLLGEDNDFSTDAIFTEMGWRTEDANWFNKSVRFLAHAGVDVGLDPISWATGGLAGVSKKAAGTGMAKIVSKFGDDAVRAARAGTDDITDAGAKVVKEAIEARRGKVDELIKKNIDSGMDADDAADAAWEAVREEAEFETLIKPLKAIAERDFKSMPDWVRNSKAIQSEMPWVQGGLRLTVPMGGGLRSGLGKPIPGTVGLGRKLTRGVFRPRGGEVRDGIRQTLKNALPIDGGMASRSARAFLSKFNANAPIITAWRQGTFEGVQVGQFMLDAANRARTELGLRDLERINGRAAQTYIDATKSLNPAELEQTNLALRQALGSGRLDTIVDALPETLGPEQRRVIHEWAETYRTTMDSIHRVYADLVPSAGAQTDYMPLVFKDGFRDFVRALGRDAEGGIPIFDDAPEELQEGLSMLSQMVAAAQRAGSNGQSVVGDPKFLRTRTMGLEVDPAELQDMGGVQLLRGADRLGVGFQSHDEINEKLMAAAEWVAKRENMKLKTGKWKPFGDSTLEGALELDPLVMMNRYMDSMMGALQERYIIKKSLDVGLLRPGDYRTDIHRSIQQTFENLTDKKTQTMIDDLARALTETIEGEEGRVAEAFAETKTVYLGGSMGNIELPASAVSDPSPLLRRRIDEAKTRARAWESAKVTRERRATELKEQLVAQGVNENVAAALAAAGSVSDMRSVLRQAVRDADNAAREAAHRVDEIGVRFGTASDEALKAQNAARREAARVRRTAEQVAEKSRRKLNKELDREVKRLTKGRAFRAVFSDEADRKALVDRIIPQVVDDLATRGAPEEFVEAIEAQMRRLALGDAPEEIAAEIATLKATIIDSLPTEVSTNRLEGLAELARQAGRALRDAGVVDDDAIRLMDEAGLTGPGNVFEVVAGYRDRLGQAFRSARNLPERMRKPQMDRLQRAFRLVDDTEEAFRAAVSAPEADAGLRDWLQSNDLLNQMELIRRLVAGEDVMTAPRAVVGQLKRMLDDLGITGEGRRLYRSKTSRTGFEVLGEPEEWATVAELRDEVRRLGGDLADITPEIAEQLSERARRTWANLGQLPEHVRALQNLETTIREGARLAEAMADGGRMTAERIARSAQKANRTWLDFEEQVLRPFRKKTATVTELEAADAAFRTQYPALRKILAPSEIPQLDMFGEELARRRALRTAGTTDEYREAVDAINLYKQTMFDEETTAETLRQLSEQVARRKAEATTQEAMRSYTMLEQMGDLFKNLLGMTRDADGNVIRRVLNDEEREVLTKYIEKGKRLWDNIDDLKGKSPFEEVVVPTAERPGFVPPSAYNMGGQAWDGLVGDRYAMEWMGNMSAQVASMYNSEVLTRTVRNMRSIMSWWKAQATIVRPTFHIRNAMGAIWNGMLGDVRMSNYKAAIEHGPKFIHNLNRMSFEEALELVPEQYRMAMRWADNTGVFDDMFATTELIDRQLKRRSKQKFNPLSQHGPTARAGGRVMMDIEGSVRLAVFMRHFDAAAPNPQAAARHAKAWVDAIHFNYNELTEGERWARTFIPFFVWTRRNLPLQLRTLIERPQYLRRYQHLINAADSWNDDEADDLPGSMYRAKGISSVLGKINDDTDFFSRVIFDPDLPINVLFELDQPYSPETWINLLFNQLGPQFDLLAAFQNMDDNSYYVTAPGGIGQLMNVLPPPGVDRTPRGVARVAPWASGLYRTALPALNELGGFIGEADPRRRQALGQAPDPEAEGVDSASDELKALGFTLLRGLGIQLEGVDESYSNAAVTSIRLNDIAEEMKDRGVITPEIAEKVDSLSEEELLSIVEAMSETQVGS